MALIYIVFFTVSVATTTLLSALVYLEPSDVVPSEAAAANLRRLYLSLEQYADGHLNHGLNAGLLIPLDLVNADVILAIAC